MKSDEGGDQCMKSDGGVSSDRERCEGVGDDERDGGRGCT